MPVTLENIAEVSGYSRSTVSRVINGESGVSDKAQKRIMAVVERLNYHPNLAARGLAAGHMNNIGLIIPETVSFIFTDPYFQSLALGVTQESNERDFNVMLWLSEPEYERKTINQFLNNGLVDGVIIASMLMGDPILEALLTTRRPYVLIGQQPALTNASFVDCDNISGGYIAAQHLLQQGCQRIATITGPRGMLAAQHRLEGYTQALNDQGLQIDESLMVAGKFTEESGYLGMKLLLKEKPDAVFIASDIMALGAYHALKEAGVRIPEDIAIIGFDDIPYASQLTPPLTTMRQPIRNMGGIAADMLIDLIMHPDQNPKHTILSPELIIRNSTTNNN